MELINGGTLEKFIKEEKYKQKKSLRFEIENYKFFKNGLNVF